MSFAFVWRRCNGGIKLTYNNTVVPLFNWAARGVCKCTQCLLTIFTMVLTSGLVFRFDRIVSNTRVDVRHFPALTRPALSTFQIDRRLFFDFLLIIVFLSFFSFLDSVANSSGPSGLPQKTSCFCLFVPFVLCIRLMAFFRSSFVFFSWEEMGSCSSCYWTDYRPRFLFCF